MKIEKGTLKKIKNGFQVVLPTKKGSAAFPIPEAAKQFKDSDADEGTEVDVEKDAQNRIVKVVVPGKDVVAAVVTQPKGKGRSRTPYQNDSRGKSKSNIAVQDLPKASPKVLGAPFHNPYTFLDFPTKGPARQKPTALTDDEQRGNGSIFTGVLRVKLKTVTPLLTSHPESTSPENVQHKSYKALTIENDVILPATGVRGFLRSLLSITTGGTLSYLNENTYLCQGRDLDLGPATEKSKPRTPKEVFLAEVVTPGDYFQSGAIRVGETKLISLTALKSVNHNRDFERTAGKGKFYVGLDMKGNPTKISPKYSDDTPWQLKLSGTPVTWKGKREGLLLTRGTMIEISPRLWAEYLGRHAGSDRPALKKGDLIWLEPAEPNQAPNSIKHEGQIKSLQWARWGRRGQMLTDDRVVPSYLMPDYLTNDGKVDVVTNMFGLVSPGTGNSPDFAGKVRPANLVFEDAKSRVENVTLAPLSAPKPGCIAMYRRATSPDKVSIEDPYQGYKVYRTAKPGDQPWLFETQGVYEDSGELKDAKQSVNNSVQLLPAGETGSLMISFRSLSKMELALLVLACQLPWRLGGGKPLGLGLCQVESYEFLDEFGDAIPVDDWNSEIDRLNIADRIKAWNASQEPVERLRYPRAVNRNNHRNNRGGHIWFARHAQPRKGKDKSGKRYTGLDPLYIDGELLQQVKSVEEVFDPTLPMISGQILRAMDLEDPNADQLYGYDLINVESRNDQKPNRNTFLKMEEFDESKHITGDEKSAGNQGKNKEMRDRNKKNRRKK